MRLAYLSLPLILGQFLVATSALAAGCPQTAVHCAYVKGLSENLNDGRYLKLVHGNIKLVVCVNNIGFASISQESAGQFEGRNIDRYSICTDKSGVNCQPVGTDEFVVSKKGHEYIAEPRYFAIDLTDAQKSFPVCDALDSKLQLPA